MYLEETSIPQLDITLQEDMQVPGRRSDSIFFLLASDAI